MKMPPAPQKTYITEQYRSCSSRSASKVSHHEQPIKLSEYGLLKAIGISGTIAFSSRNNEKSSALSLIIPLPWRLGSQAFTVQLLLKSLKSSLFTSQLSRGLLCIRNIVPDESRIMVACERGDVPAVQQLLETKTASPHDTTRAGITPLLVGLLGTLLPH